MATTLIKCIDDAAYIDQATKQAAAITSEAYTWAAIQLALMLAQRTVGKSISDMQEAIANRRMVLGEEVLEHAKKTWAKEKEFVDEVMAVPKVQADYGYAQIMVTEVDRVEDLAIDGIDTKLGRMGISVGACDDLRTRRLMGNVRTDLVSHSMRAAEGRSVGLNDRRYSQQVTAVALGRNVLQQSISMGALAGGKQLIGDSLIRTLNSGMSLWGYSANRWRHGGNFVTGENGAPTIVRPGYSMVRSTNAITGQETVSMQTERMAELLTANSGDERAGAAVQGEGGY